MANRPGTPPNHQFTVRVTALGFLCQANPPGWFRTPAKNDLFCLLSGKHRDPLKREKNNAKMQKTKNMSGFWRKKTPRNRPMSSSCTGTCRAAWPTCHSEARRKKKRERSEFVTQEKQLGKPDPWKKKKKGENKNNNSIGEACFLPFLGVVLWDKAFLLSQRAVHDSRRHQTQSCQG